MQKYNKVAVLEAVAAAWNQAGIIYAVAHGIDGYPATIGRDLQRFAVQLNRNAMGTH